MQGATTTSVSSALVRVGAGRSLSVYSELVTGLTVDLLGYVTGPGLAADGSTIEGVTVQRETLAQPMAKIFPLDDIAPAAPGDLALVADAGGRRARARHAALLPYERFAQQQRGWLRSWARYRASHCPPAR